MEVALGQNLKEQLCGPEGLGECILRQDGKRGLEETVRGKEGMGGQVRKALSSAAQETGNWHQHGWQDGWDERWENQVPSTAWPLPCSVLALRGIEYSIVKLHGPKSLSYR